MKIKLRESLVGLILFMYPWQVYAAAVINMELEISKNDELSKNTHIITVDDKKVRVDYLDTGDKKTKTTPYLLTLNAGKSWVLGNQEKGEFYCAKVDMKDFFRDLGDIISRVDSFTNAKFSDDKLVLLLDEPGPEILGYSTTHVRFRTTARIKAAVLFKEYEFTLNKVDDIWYAKDNEVHPAKKRWIEALTQSGYETLDELSSELRANIRGPILKQESVIQIANIKKNKLDTYGRKIRVVSIQELESSAVAEETFIKPNCKKINKSQTKGVAKSMFKEGKLTF